MDPSAGTESTSPEAARRAYQKSFAAKVQRFMVTNTKVFNELTKDAPFGLSSKPPKSNYYGDPLPLEYVMGIPAHICQQRLLQLLTPGDIVRGHVILKTPLALGVQITSLVASSKVRDFSGLEIRGLVQHENLATDKTRCDGVLQEMEVDDVIQAVVLNQQESHFNLSFNAEHVSRLCPSGALSQGMHLGYLEGARAASDRKRPASSDLFLSELEDFSGFSNPCSSDNLKEELGVVGYWVDTKPSLISTIQTAKYPASDYYDTLRKVQRHKWSLDTVGVGVDHFKKGEVKEALKLLNHALDIDPTNVEGLVARGVLSANAGKYSEAIVDFEAALTINHTHKNARKYLVDAQVSYGEELEKQGRFERAIVCYQEAVTDDPSQEVAKTRLELLKRVLQKKAAEKVEKERKEAAEKARLKKLHSLIKEEKEKKKKTKAKKRKEGKRIHVKKKKTYARRALKHSDTNSSDSSVSSRSRESPDARKKCSPSTSHNRVKRSNSRESLGTRKRKHYSHSRESPDARKRNYSSRSPSHNRVKMSHLRESLDARKKHSRSPSTPLCRSKGTKGHSSPSHSSSWYKGTRSYLRSKLRSSESPKGKRPRSPASPGSPRESRRTSSKSPLPRAKRLPSSPLTPRSKKTRSPLPRSQKKLTPPSPKSKKTRGRLCSPSPRRSKRHSPESSGKGHYGSLSRESLGSNSRISYRT